MRKKFTKVLGVLLALTLLTSLIAVATPASAATLLIYTDSNVPKTDDNVISPLAGLNILDIAVNGDTIYAATSSDNYPLFKSVNAGQTWTNLDTSTSFPSGVYATSVAVALDDPDVVVIATSADLVEYSSNGGSSWSNLGAPETNADIADVDVSVAVAGKHYVAASGNLSGAKLYVQKLDIGQVWYDRTTYDTGNMTATQTNMPAVKFSTNFDTDKIITVVSGNATSATFQVFREETGAESWNGGISFFNASDWSGGLVLTGAITGGLASASIAMPSTFLGTEEGERVVFVGIAGTTTGGGLTRILDAYEKEFTTWSAGDEGMIHSVAYNDDSGILLAGDYDAAQVYRDLEPLATTPRLERLTSLKQPGGSTKTVVGWSGDNAVAGTYGDESCFALSTDDGNAFNDLSLIDTAISVMDDVAISEDGKKVYLTTHDASNDTSVWVKDEGIWYRVLSKQGMTASTAPFLVRIAPEDQAVVYISSKTTTDMWTSSDSGMAKWKHVPCYKLDLIQDFEVQDADTLFAIDTSQCSKSTNAGASWGSAKGLDGVTGSTITLAPNGDVLVGGASGKVAFSTDGGATFTRILDTTDAKPVHIVADKDYADNQMIYIAAGNEVERGKVDKDTTFASREPGSSEYGYMDTTWEAKGIAQNEGVVYVLATDGTDSRLYRALNLKDAATSSLALWSYYSTGYEFERTPRALKQSEGDRFWAIDTDTTLCRVKDPIAFVGPTVKAPANDELIPMNPVTGRAHNVTFNWTRYASKYVTKMDLQIATDSAFDGIVHDVSFTGIDKDAIAKVVGPTGTPSSTSEIDFVPGKTYYWRIRVSEDGPAFSPWSEVRSFEVAPALAFTVSSPASGSTNVATMPTLVWNPVEGAVEYFVVVSTDPAFETILMSSTTENTFYAVEKGLDYDTTYYWRVRPTPEGAWAKGIFTTKAEPAEPTPPVVIEPTPAPAPPEIIEVPTPVVVQQAIPQWILITIIIIGAILFIALIVLIVRTRRVA